LNTPETKQGAFQICLSVVADATRFHNTNLPNGVLREWPNYTVEICVDCLVSMPSGCQPDDSQREIEEALQVLKVVKR
jgi:hypothetical protein